MRTTLTTTEAATMLGMNPRSFARWAYNHGVRPMHRVRIGRSTVTAWSMSDLAKATAPEVLVGRFASGVLDGTPSAW